MNFTHNEYISRVATGAEMVGPLVWLPSSTCIPIFMLRKRQILKNTALGAQKRNCLILKLFQFRKHKYADLLQKRHFTLNHKCCLWNVKGVYYFIILKYSALRTRIGIKTQIQINFRGNVYEATFGKF